MLLLVGNIVSAAILLFLMLFSGFLLNFASIPVWLIWLRYVDLTLLYKILTLLSINKVPIVLQLRI
jgi:hypothetical protein